MGTAELNTGQTFIAEPTRIVKRERPESLPVESLNPAQMVNLALSRGVSGDQLNQVLAFAKEWVALQQLQDQRQQMQEKEAARKAFVSDIVEFKKNAPVFHKTKHVDYGAGKAKFDYAPLSEVVSKIVPALAEHGFSHRWASRVVDGKVIVKCYLTHRLGHVEEEESIPVAPGTNPAMSPSQNMQATISYWERMTFQAITGTAASDMPDIDETQKGAEPETIGDGQLANIRALLTETNSSEESFLRVIKAKRLEDIHVASYSMVVGLLEAKRKQA